MYYNYKFTTDDLFAAYLRKSQADDPNEPIELTLSKHKKRLLEIMKKYNIKEEQITFYEEVVSGDTIAERPQMQKLLNDINNNNFKGVFVVAVDRFSRGDSIDQGIVNNSFYYSDTLIITPDKIFDITNNEMDREQLEFGLFMSKREYNLIKKRMYQGRLDNVKKGFFVGSTPPFGYNKKRSDEKGYILIPNDMAEIVKEMFNMALKGYGEVKIAKYLNSIGIKPKRSNKWSASMVRSILIRPVYYGIIQWGENTSVKKMVNGKIIKKAIRNKNYLEIEGKHEPLITKETFDEVQRIMGSNYRSKVISSKQLQNPLAGLIICGYCLEHEHTKKIMKRKPGGESKIINGKKYYAHKPTIICNNIDCKNVASDLAIVEKRIIDSLNVLLIKNREYLNNYEQEIKIENKSNSRTLNYIEKEIEKNKKQLKKAQEFYELGDYTRNEFLQRKDELTSKLIQLEQEKKETQDKINNNKIEIIKKQIPKLENCINNYYKINSIEEKNKLLKSIIKKVVYTKKEKGTWNKNLIDKFELTIELLT